MPNEDRKAESQSPNQSYLVLRTDDDGRPLRFSLTFDLEGTRDNITKPFDETITSLMPTETDNLEEELERIESSFATFLHQFSKNIKAFYHLSAITPVIRYDMSDGFLDKRLFAYARKELTLVEDSKTLKIFGVRPEQYSETRKRSHEVGEFMEGARQMPSLCLMGLVARYDAQISSFVRLLLRDRPEAIGSRQSEFDLKTVLNFENIEDLKDFFIDQEIYKLMHSSHHDQIVFIEETFHISIRDKLEDYPKFMEVFERRNLVAHGEGAVNTRYDARCKQHKVSADHRLEVGSKINLTAKYLFSATDLIYKVGFIIIWSLWMKRHKDEAELAYGVVLETTFDLILEGRFALVSSILDYVLSIKFKGIDDVGLRMLSVNKSICDKRLKKKDWRDAIEQFNWGACTSNFKICIAAIDEDIDTVCGLMEEVSSSALPQNMRIGSSDFRTWPAFHWVRDQSKFMEQFKHVFDEELSVQSKHAKDDDAASDKALEDAVATD